MCIGNLPVKTYFNSDLRVEEYADINKASPFLVVIIVYGEQLHSRIQLPSLSDIHIAICNLKGNFVN